MASLASLPMPGTENTVSMMTEPPSMAAMRILRRVTVEIMALRITWRVRTSPLVMPLLRAKST